MHAKGPIHTVTHISGATASNAVDVDHLLRHAPPGTVVGRKAVVVEHPQLMIVDPVARFFFYYTFGRRPRC